MSIDISRENYDYLIQMSKHTNIKLGPLLNKVMDRVRINGADIATSIIKECLLDEKLKLIEKNIQEQSILLEELMDFKRTIG